MKHYIVVPGIYDYSKYIFNDLRNLSNCTVINTKKRYVSSVINKIYLSRKINSKINLPFKVKWYKHYLESLQPDPKTEYVIIFCDSNSLSYDKQFVLWMKRRFNDAKTVFFFMNSVVQLPSSRIGYVNNSFDFVVSYDKQDCQKFKWNYYCGIYCKNESIQKESKYDIFFVGSNKGRVDMLKTAYNLFTKNGLTCDFYITGVNRKEVDDSGIHYNKKLSYDEVLSRVNSSRILFEAVQPGQTGCTLRTYEAIAYKKLLVTNNMTVRETRIADESNMLFYENVNKISIDTLKKYKYHRNRVTEKDLSPKLFVQYLEELTK